MGWPGNLTQQTLLSRSFGGRPALKKHTSSFFVPQHPEFITMAGALKRFIPMFDRVLLEKAQQKVLQGTVVAAGPGARNEKGETIPMSVTVGDKVMLPEYGGTKVELENKEYHLFRESDLLAKLSE